jgi:hypothetical protein
LKLFVHVPSELDLAIDILLSVFAEFPQARSFVHIQVRYQERWVGAKLGNKSFSALSPAAQAVLGSCLYALKKNQVECNRPSATVIFLLFVLQIFSVQ